MLFAISQLILHNNENKEKKEKIYGFGLVSLEFHHQFGIVSRIKKKTKNYENIFSFGVVKFFKAFQTFQNTVLERNFEWVQKFIKYGHVFKNQKAKKIKQTKM